MPQAANMAILDGLATPVSHVFVPSKVSDLVTTFFGPGNTLATRERITITRREATATVAGKVSIKTELPVEMTVDGVVVLNYSQASYQEFVLAPKGSKESRKNVRILASNLLKDPLVATVIDDGDGIF